MGIEARRRASRVRRVVIATTVAGLLLAGAPATGAPVQADVVPAGAEGDVTGLREGPVLERVQREITRLGGIRDAAVDGTISHVLREMAVYAELDVPALTISQDGVAVNDRLTGVPRKIAALAAAVEWSAARITELVGDDLPAPQVQDPDVVVRGGMVTEAVPGFALPEVDDAVLAEIVAMSIWIAEAVEAALPAMHLLAAEVGEPHTEGLVEGCDVVDLAPLLCIAGTGDNRHVEEYMLLIDLGGNDRYENSAGGAAGGAAASSGLHPVSIVVDLAGDDVYEHVIRRDALQLSHGAALYGIGMLIDLEGDDRYLRRVHPGEGGPSLQNAQGSGASGVGVLADFGGNDEYLVEDSGVCCSYHQGVGLIGLGLLLDRAGDDVYELRGGHAAVAPGPDGSLLGASRFAEGQGFGSAGGVGALVDLEGDDLFLAHASAEVPPIYRSYQEQSQTGGPRAGFQVQAQGIGSLGGAGLLLTGHGDATFRIEGEGTGLTTQFTYGQGLSTDAGVGILHNLGGDDEYIIRSNLSAERTSHVDQACACPGAEALLDERYFMNPQNVAGQGVSGTPGFGNIGAVGLLIDESGDDRYKASMTGLTRAEAVAEGTAQHATAVAVSFNGSRFRAQGAAEVSGLGALIDLDGDDEYDVVLHVVAEATATAADPQDAHAEAHGRSSGLTGGADVLAQGAGAGDAASAALIDLGGRDHYAARLRTEAVASPTPGGATEDRIRGTVQGSGPQGLLIDRDMGELDTFEAEPNFLPMAHGRRGEAPGWVEAAQQRRGVNYSSPLRPLGVGIVTSSQAKQDSHLTVDEVIPGPREGLLTIAGRLTDAAGEPLPSAWVDIRLEEERADSVAFLWLPSSGWHNRVATHGVTTADGSFTAVLNIQEAEGDGQTHRLFVGYSGAASRRGTVTTMELPKH